MESAVRSLRYTYRHTFNGFSAKMSAEQADARLVGMPGVISVFRSQKLILHTTRSWDFLGLPRLVLSQGSGLSPKAFQMTAWDLFLTAFTIFLCRKIIGSRYYDAGITDKLYLSGRDEIGHGSHTGSTAAGRQVSGARIAVYKVCWVEEECADDAMLAAIDEAIKDGVDILSMSLGPDTPQPYNENAISIGTFHAALHGVSVSCSVGNQRGPGTVVNGAPWVLSVGASTTDRNRDETSQPPPAPAVAMFSSRGPNILKSISA